MVRDALRIVREVVPVVVVAVLVCHLIRTHLLEWYIVPSTSMAPTLHGDPDDGDLVLVDKTAYWFEEPERHEMVVLRNDEDPPRGHLVKRFIARGSDDENVVRINEGDVFLGPNRQQLKRLVKHPLAADELRHTHFVFPEIGRQRVAQYFRKSSSWSVESRADGGKHVVLGAAAPTFTEAAAALRDAGRGARRPGPPRHLSTRRPVDTTFLNDAGKRMGGSESWYPDIGMEFDVDVAGGCVGLQLVFEYRGSSFVFHYARDGAVRWLASDSSKEIARRGAPLQQGQTASISFGYLDGRFFLIADGALLFHEELALAKDPAAAPAGRGPDNLLHLGAIGGEVRLRRVRVFHDVYYKALRSPFGSLPTPSMIEPDNLYLLGDNTFESRDSRSGRSFPRSDLVGRPLAVIGPLSRMRWLDQ